MIKLWILYKDLQLRKELWGILTQGMYSLDIYVIRVPRLIAVCRLIDSHIIEERVLKQFFLISETMLQCWKASTFYALLSAHNAWIVRLWSSDRICLLVFFRTQFSDWHKCFICTLLKCLLLCILDSHWHPTPSFPKLQACFLFLFRAGSDEIDRQKVGENGYHAGSPEAAHPTAGPAAPCPGGSQDPSTSHTR